MILKNVWSGSNAQTSRVEGWRIIMVYLSIPICGLLSAFISVCFSPTGRLDILAKWELMTFLESVLGQSIYGEDVLQILFCKELVGAQTLI